MSNDKKIRKLLLIDDDEIEQLKFTRVLKKNNRPHEVIIAQHGEAALELLNQNTTKPDVIFMDLNMPRMNGLELLQKLKSNPLLCHIPVVVLSTSSSETDLKACYTLGIAGYISKPLHYEAYANCINCLINYWEINTLYTTE